MWRKTMAKRYGNQTPRIDIYKNGEIWLADKTIQLLEYYGIKLLPWQKRILYRWMAVVQDETGNWVWANPDCGLLVPRQNGKSELLIGRIVGGMVFLGEALIYTAQSQTTVSEIKRRVQRFFYDAEAEVRNMLTDEFEEEPKSLDYIELRNRGRCVFRTRTRTNGLGSTNDTLLLDEDQEENDAQQEALLPTIAAGKSQNHQTIRAGTPPTTGSSGTVFLRMRKNVLDGKTTEICWQEWSVETITDPKDKEAWYATNPSLGYFLMESAVKAESEKMAVDSFNKMRLGWIAGVENMRAITDEQWAPLAIDKVEITDETPVVYSVKFAPDGSAVSLAIGALLDNSVHVEVVERKPMSAGTNWLAQWLLERVKRPNKIIIDGASGTQLLVEELVRSNPKMSKLILTPNTKEAGAAYAGFMAAIEQKTLTHFDQPTLNLSIRTVKKRSIGKDGMYGYASMNPDIQSDPTEAAAFAHYGIVRFGSEKKKEKSRQRVMI